MTSFKNIQIILVVCQIQESIFGGDLSADIKVSNLDTVKMKVNCVIYASNI